MCGGEGQSEREASGELCGGVGGVGDRTRGKPVESCVCVWGGGAG